MYKWTATMKHTLTIALAIGLLVVSASTAQAIDAKKKSGSSASTTSAVPDSSRSKTAVQKSKAASSKSLLERLKKDVRESSKKSGSDKYDNYIDANNDGVDDRVKDRPATVESAKARDSEKSKESKPAEDDSARVRVKKKPR